MKALKTWWQMRTGQEETPLDGDTPAWITSLLFHMCLLIVLGLVGWTSFERKSIVLTIPDVWEEEEDDLKVPKEFEFNPTETDQIGAVANDSFDAPAPSIAPVISDLSVVPPLEREPEAVGDFQAPQLPALPTGLRTDGNVAIRGSVGVGTSGALGALDIITQKIKQSLEQRATHVIWIFDQSYSLNAQRRQVNARFRQIYKELGVIEDVDHKAFKQHKDKGNVPLLTSVMAFGRQHAFLTPAPTDDLALIIRAVEGIKNDPTGDENVFQAIYDVAEKNKNMRKLRNVMIVVFTDEVGDDQRAELEATIRLCRRYVIPVYVVGVPAPFGRDKTWVKWVDPDPKYDQSPQWGEVVQGPESFMPERVKLSFGPELDDDPIDSGFGPYSLTRLTYETGGVYFKVHPNRVVNREVTEDETEVLASHLKHFFDEKVMRPYVPDYVSTDEYKKMVESNKARYALVMAARQSWANAMNDPPLHFPKKNEADLASRLAEAHRLAAQASPRINNLAKLLKAGEADRERETKPRWKAGYDLAMGRVLAAKVRADGYNALLAKAQVGLKFENADSDTWDIRPSADIAAGGSLADDAKQATMYLNRVIREHQGTPWALLARNELQRPMGWTWIERHTGVNDVRRNNGGNNNGGLRRDDRRDVVERPKPKPRRSVPRL